MKQFEALYIDGQLVNIGTSDITLEWKSVMLSNISKLKVNHSYTIKLPMTVNNRRVFGAAEDAAHNAYTIANNGKTFIGKRMKARYYCNGIDLLGDASAFLIGVDKENYKVVLTWGSLAVMSDIISEDRTLPQIFDNEESRPTTIDWEHWTSDTISDALAGKVANIPYIKTDNMDITTTYAAYTGELPSFKVTWLIDLIFKKYGVKYDFTKTYANNVTKMEELLDTLYCPMVTMNDSKYIQGYNHTKWFIDQVYGYYEHRNNDIQYAELRSSNPLFLERISSVYPQGQTTPCLGWCGAHMNMKYKLKVHLRVFVFAFDLVSGDTWVKANVKLAIANGQGEESNNIATLDATSVRAVGFYAGATILNPEYSTCYEVIFDYDEWVEVDEGDSLSGDYWKDWTYDQVLIERQKRCLRITHPRTMLDVSAVSFFIFDMKSTIDPNWQNWVDICPVLTTGKVWNDSYAAITNVDEKTPLYLEPNFPDLKPIDFLKAVFYVIGAFPVVVNDTLKLTLYQELVDNVKKALDWSRHVIDDNDIPDTIDFELTEWAKKNWMRYKDDDEDSPKYSGYFEINDDYLSDEADVFTLPFQGCNGKGGAHVPIWEIGKVLLQVAFPAARNSEVTEVDGYVFKEAKPLILRGIKNEYPAIDVGWVVVPAGSITVFDTEALNFANPDSIVRQRYNVFAELLRHPYVITVNMELDEITLGKLDMSIPVFLRQYGSYFGIISIKRKSDGLCTVKLLRIPNTLITSV